MICPMIFKNISAQRKGRSNAGVAKEGGDEDSVQSADQDTGLLSKVRASTTDADSEHFSKRQLGMPLAPIRLLPQYSR